MGESMCLVDYNKSTGEVQKYRIYSSIEKKLNYWDVCVLTNDTETRVFISHNPTNKPIFHKRFIGSEHLDKALDWYHETYTSAINSSSNIVDYLLSI